jgi:hypothetical protein
MLNFHFDLSLKFSKGEVHDFSREVQNFSGEVQNNVRGGAHTSPQNPAMPHILPITLWVFLHPHLASHLKILIGMLIV